MNPGTGNPEEVWKLPRLVRPKFLFGLTGFDGRCDAIYFTQESDPQLPGDDLKELSDWKDEVSGRSKEKVEELSFDLVIVGGGISGVVRPWLPVLRG